MIRFVLLILVALSFGSAEATTYYRSYYYRPVGWKYYCAQWYHGCYYRAGYYAMIGSQWHLQGYGPYSGEAPAPSLVPAPPSLPPTLTPVPVPALTPEEVGKLKEILKKLDTK